MCQMSRVLALILLALVFSASMIHAQNATMSQLIDQYELALNTMNVTMISQLFSQNATALLPAGNTPIYGNGNITLAYAFIFAQLDPGSLNETINVELVNGDYGAIEQTYTARVGNCSISLPVVQWFQSYDNMTIDLTGIVYNATAFANQVNCNGQQNSPPWHEARVMELFQTFEWSQNNMNATVATSVFSNDAVVLMPIGSGPDYRVVGNGNISNAFGMYFATFHWINETVNTIVINNNAIGVEKTFSAMTVTNCTINMPVIQWFFTNANCSLFDYAATIFNQTVLIQQANCNNNSNTNGSAASALSIMWGLAIVAIAMIF